MEICPLNHLEAILSFMDFTLLHQYYPYNPHKRGPKGYEKEHLLRSLIGMQVQQLPEIKALVGRIKDVPVFKRTCGFEYTDNPSESTFSRFITDLTETNILERTYRRMLSKARDLGLLGLDNVAIDASKIDAYEHSIPKKKIPENDLEHPHWGGKLDTNGNFIISMQGEVAMTVLTSIAQQESESISSNIKMGLKMKMKRGELVGFQGCLGYDYNKETKELVLNEEEAKVVQFIYERYNEGMGARVIGRELEAKGYWTKRGSLKWGESTVRGILKNKKYVGDLLLGKTFTVDPITKQRLDNMGEEEQYYIRDHHIPIVSREVYDEAQAIRNKRNCNLEKGKLVKYSRQYTFSSKIKCGFCDATVGRRATNSGTKSKKVVWHCITSSKKGKRFCEHSQSVPENIIEEAFAMVFNKMTENSHDIIEEFITSLERSLGDSTTKKDLSKLSKELAMTEDKIKKLINLHLDGAIDRKNYEEMFKDLENTKEKQLEQINQLTLDSREEKNLKDRLRSFRKYFDNNKQLKKFDKAVFDSIVERIILGGVNDQGQNDPHLITFVSRPVKSRQLVLAKMVKMVQLKASVKSKEIYIPTFRPHMLSVL